MNKRAEDLTLHELAHIVWYVMQRQQELEVQLAAVVALVLADHNEIGGPEPSEYADTVLVLKAFLHDATDHIKQFNDATDRLMAEIHSSN